MKIKLKFYPIREHYDDWHYFRFYLREEKSLYYDIEVFVDMVAKFFINFTIKNKLNKVSKILTEHRKGIKPYIKSDIIKYFSKFFLPVDHEIDMYGKITSGRYDFNFRFEIDNYYFHSIQIDVKTYPSWGLHKPQLAYELSFIGKRQYYSIPFKVLDVVIDLSGKSLYTFVIENSLYDREEYKDGFRFINNKEWFNEFQDEDHLYHETWVHYYVPD